MKFSKLALAVAASLISVAAFADAPADFTTDGLTTTMTDEMASGDLSNTTGYAFIKQTDSSTANVAYIDQNNADGGNFAYINQAGEAGTAAIIQAGSANYAMIRQQ